MKPSARGPGFHPRSRVTLPWLLAANGAIALCAAAAASEGPGIVRMLAAGLLVLVIPGAAWLGMFRRAPIDTARLALALVGVSSLSAIALLTLTALGTRARLLAGPDPSGHWRVAALLWTFLVVNAGLLFAGLPGRVRTALPPGVLAGIALGGFAIASLAGLRLVPPLEDHDMEVRGTAWGLAATGRPYFQTNREVFFPLAHPLLFHVQVAESLIWTGQVGATRPSYDSAIRHEQAARRGTAARWEDAWRDDYRAFLASPALTGTRAAGALYAGLLLALLADLVAQLTGSGWAGAGAAALFASCPETIVRSAYAGYFSVAVFAMLCASSLFASEDAPRGWFIAAGALAAVVDHKTLVLVVGACAVAAVRIALRLAAGKMERRIFALSAGFGAGTLAWWVYGLWVDPAVFVRDHVRMHILHRFLLNDLRMSHDAARYAPSMAELWAEFCAHTGYLLVPVALAGLVGWLVWPRARASTGGADARVVLASWGLAGAVLFTLTDWRQTKHLMNQLAPMVAAATALALPRPLVGENRFPGSGRKKHRGAGGPEEGSLPGERSEGAPSREPGDIRADTRRASTLRWGLALALTAAFLLNLRADLRLARDFRSLTVSGASDVDGW